MSERTPLKAKKRLKANPSDHVLHRMLKDAGYTNKGMARMLSVSQLHLAQLFRENGKRLTVWQLCLIAGLLEVPVMEVLALTLGKHKTAARAEGKKWYDTWGREHYF